MNKKKVGTLFGRPIVVGDPNIVTSNEILLEELESNKIDLKTRNWKGELESVCAGGGGSTGGNSIYKYLVFNESFFQPASGVRGTLYYTPSSGGRTGRSIPYDCFGLTNNQSFDTSVGYSVDLNNQSIYNITYTHVRKVSENECVFGARYYNYGDYYGIVFGIINYYIPGSQPDKYEIHSYSSVYNIMVSRIVEYGSDLFNYIELPEKYDTVIKIQNGLLKDNDQELLNILLNKLYVNVDEDYGETFVTLKEYFEMCTREINDPTKPFTIDFE